jgi:hypothetical protein
MRIALMLVAKCDLIDWWLTWFALQDEARILVQSEDEPERTLLETKISKDNGYHPQQGQKFR